MYYLLYEITNLVNGKTYIGQHTTKNVDDGYMGSGMAIKAAIKKYGKENFKKEILLYAKNEVALNFFEKALVTLEFIELDTNYNLREGGGNNKFSEEVKKKLSAARRGVKRSLETRAKISAYQKGRKKSPETRAKISIARKGIKFSLETRAKMSALAKISPARKGKRHSAETKAKMSAAHKGKKKPPRKPEATKKMLETKRKNGTTGKGKKFSPEHCLNMSLARKGKKRSTETKAKISATLKMKKLNQQLLTCNGLSILL